MMLKTVKDLIDKSKDINFSQYYNDYILSVQDRNLELEMKYLIRFNTLTPKSFDSLIEHTYNSIKQVVSNNDSIK